MDPKGFYEIIGGVDTDTPDELKKKYQRKVREYHPDRNRDDPDAVGKFDKLKRAYEVLSDPKKKELYDDYGCEEFERFAEALENDDYEYNDYGSDSESDYYNYTDSEDFDYAGQEVPLKANMYLKLPIPLRDIYHGCTQSFKTERFNDAECKPFRYIDPEKGEMCKLTYTGKDPQNTKLTIKIDPLDPNLTFDKRGFLAYPKMGNAIPELLAREVGFTRGTVYIIPHTSRKCFMMGFNPEAPTFDFNKANEVDLIYGKCPEVINKNLYKEIELDPVDAMCGFKFRIDHPMGKFIIIKDWKKHVRNRDLYVFKGLGMPDYGNKGKFGDLYIRFMVPPLQLKPAQRKQLRKLLTGKEELETLDLDKRISYNKESYQMVRKNPEFYDETPPPNPPSVVDDIDDPLSCATQ